jgi:hypothetical protein
MEQERRRTSVDDETRTDMPRIAEATPFGAPPATTPVTGTGVPTAPAAPVEPVAAVETERTYVERPVVSETESTGVRTTSRISPASIAAGAASVVLLVFGGVNLARAGTDAPLDEPVVQVAGIAGTAIVGIIALAVGLVMLIAAVIRSRAAIVTIALLMAVAGAIVLIEPTVGDTTLGIERDMGVALLVLGGIVALVSLLAPDVRRTSEHYERH